MRRNFVEISYLLTFFLSTYSLSSFFPFRYTPLNKAKHCRSGGKLFFFRQGIEGLNPYTEGRVRQWLWDLNVLVFFFDNRQLGDRLKSNIVGAAMWTDRAFDNEHKYT